MPADAHSTFGYLQIINNRQAHVPSHVCVALLMCVACDTDDDMACEAEDVSKDQVTLAYQRQGLLAQLSRRLRNNTQKC